MTCMTKLHFKQFRNNRVIFSAMLIPILPEVACISKSCLRILENMNEKKNMQKGKNELQRIHL